MRGKGEYRRRGQMVRGCMCRVRAVKVIVLANVLLYRIEKWWKKIQYKIDSIYNIKAYKRKK